MKTKKVWELNLCLALVILFACATPAFCDPPLRVYAWGWDQFGECDVPADLTNAVQVAVGGNTSFALLSNGTVSAWGENGYCSSSSGEHFDKRARELRQSPNIVEGIIAHANPPK